MQVNETRPAGTAVRLTVQQLTVRNGFTLTIGSVLAVTIGNRGYPGMLPVWLFAVGGSAGFCLVALISRASPMQSPAVRPGTGLTVFNLVPVAVVPIVYAATRWVPATGLAFAMAGFLAVVLCLAGYSACAAGTKRMQPGGPGVYPACPASARSGSGSRRYPDLAVASGSRRYGTGFWLVRSYGASEWEFRA
jgi:hypothetical protein